MRLEEAMHSESLIFVDCLHGGVGGEKVPLNPMEAGCSNGIEVW